MRFCLGCAILKAEPNFRISDRSSVISKRKPPSKRPERKLDETARAIARARQDIIDQKAEESRERNKNRGDNAGMIGTVPSKLAHGLVQPGPLPETSSKQPKKPG